MRAWRVTRPGPMTTGPLRLSQEPRPEPAAGEVLVRVLACGVCRTDLHVSEGDLDVHRFAQHSPSWKVMVVRPRGEPTPAVAALMRHIV